MKRLIRDLSIAVLGGIISIAAYTAIVDGIHSIPKLASHAWHQLNHFSFPAGESLTFWGVFAGVILAQNAIPGIVKLFLKHRRSPGKVERQTGRKEGVKATYTAAEAQARINAAFSGISEEMGKFGPAIQRAKEEATAMRQNTKPPQRKG